MVRPDCKDAAPGIKSGGEGSVPEKTELHCNRAKSYCMQLQTFVPRRRYGLILFCLLVVAPALALTLLTGLVGLPDIVKSIPYGAALTTVAATVAIYSILRIIIGLVKRRYEPPIHY